MTGRHLCESSDDLICEVIMSLEQLQINMFEILDNSTKDLRVGSRKYLPKIFVAHKGEPFRTEAIHWYLDHDFEPVIHQCEPMIYERERIFYQFWKDGKLEKFYNMRPVVYAVIRNGETVWHDNNPGHHEVDKCPYCGVDLASGDGDIIVFRRGYQSGYSIGSFCYDVRWPDRKPVQPYLIEYMRVKGYHSEERFVAHEYISWISQKHIDFRKNTGWPATPGNADYKVDFLSWLRCQND